jgi:molybdopterin molybdotransferase
MDSEKINVMVAVEEARKKIQQQVNVLCDSEQVSLEMSLGRTLAKDLVAPLDTPLFDQSAMDGYAISVSESVCYEIIGEIAAGSGRSYELKPGQAVRIFTGAEVPPSANAVVMQEKTAEADGVVSLEQGFTPSVGDNIRRQGEQLQKGEVALDTGHCINPASIGFLASMGVSTVEVVQVPKVALLVSGSELVKPGEVLTKGKIYESNSYMISAALRESGIHSVAKDTVNDDLSRMKNLVKDFLENHDMVILTGGVSVGKYDLTTEVFNALEVETVFHKVSQKPGKPLYFGVYKGKPVFGLPGNPAAALSCFYEYVKPALMKMQGNIYWDSGVLKLPLAHSVSKRKGLAHFMRGKITEGKVEIFGEQGSHILRSFAYSNCQVYTPSERGLLNEGESVEVRLFHS